MKKFYYLAFVLMLSVNFYAQLITYIPQNRLSDEENDQYAYTEEHVLNGSSLVEQDPNIVPRVPNFSLDNCGKLGKYLVGHNNDFTVHVKEGGVNSKDEYQKLFEYNTFVNSSSGDWSRCTRSSFVTFEYTGYVTVRIKCNLHADVRNKVIIRPLSRGITYHVDQASPNVIYITLDSKLWDHFTDKLSVEINGDRYSNLQIFANKRKELLTNDDQYYTKVYSPEGNGTAANVYVANQDHTEEQRILIKAGAIVEANYLGPLYETYNGTILLHSGDEIFIDAGGILNGGIYAQDADQEIRVKGHGIIDLTNYPKNYVHNNNNPYAYVQAMTFRRCKSLLLKGLILNDSQQLCVELTDCGDVYSGDNTIENIRIEDLKMFSRVLWGDGFHMRGTSNVRINDCFNRTSDDAISIYASRRQNWDLCDESYFNQKYDDKGEFVSGAPPHYPAIVGCTNIPVDQHGNPVTDPNLIPLPYLNRDAANISVSHTLLYADQAHAVEIGWHGNQMLNAGLNIYHLRFNDIDVLEHDIKWVQQNGQVHYEYDGAIGITCADDNRCTDFLFTNVHIEDFTSGSILAVRVVPHGVGDAKKSGKLVQDIRFDGLYYAGTGEHPSIISGVNCDRYVDGVHFNNFKVTSDPTNMDVLTYTTVEGLNQNFNGHPMFFEYDPNNTNIHYPDYAYNVTFQEANRYDDVPVFDSAGNRIVYLIKNLHTGLYLKSSIDVQSSPSSTDPNVYNIGFTDQSTGEENKWYFQKVQDYEHYYITNFSNNQYLENTQQLFIEPNTFFSNGGSGIEDWHYDWPYYCQGRYTITRNVIDGHTDFEWKFELLDNTTNHYKIHNAYTRGFLSADLQNPFAISLPENPTTTDHQEWELIPVDVTAPRLMNANTASEVKVVPNPTKDYLNIINLKDVKAAKVEVTTLTGVKIITKGLAADNYKLYVGNLADGIYIVTVTSNGQQLYSDKFVKVH